MSRLNKILLSLTIFVLLLIGGVGLLLTQSARQEVVSEKIESSELSESSFVHKDWPITFDRDFVPGGVIITSSSEMIYEESSVSLTSTIYTQISSTSSTISFSNSTQASTSSQKANISSVANQISSREDVVESKL
jgi:hypothetical protein